MCPRTSGVHTHAFTSLTLPHILLPNCKVSLRDVSLAQARGLRSIMTDLPLGCRPSPGEHVLGPSPPACQECELWSVSAQQGHPGLGSGSHVDPGCWKGWKCFPVSCQLRCHSEEKNPRVILGTKEILLPSAGSDSPF